LPLQEISGVIFHAITMIFAFFFSFFFLYFRRYLCRLHLAAWFGHKSLEITRSDEII